VIGVIAVFINSFSTIVILYALNSDRLCDVVKVKLEEEEAGNNYNCTHKVCGEGQLDDL
jgi:hypothetical protein